MQPAAKPLYQTAPLLLLLLLLLLSAGLDVC
jgi:hypothetical protein